MVFTFFPNALICLTHLTETLNLGDNKWQGTVPDVFQDYLSLDLFDISNNQLSGTIPATVFSIPTIRLVYMSECGLSGTIPASYASAPLLRDLFLDGNGITGTVPAVASGQLELLNEFLLQDTLITGTMPDSVCALKDFSLDDLWSDCGGASPEIECDFPDCCNRCFEGGARR